MLNIKLKLLYAAILTTIFVYASGVIPSIIPAAVPTAFKQGSTGTKFQIQTGSAGVGNCPTWDAFGNLVDSGVATCGGAGGSVSSFNGRTGAVTPQSGDYSASLVTNAYDTNTNQAIGAHYIESTDIATPTNPAAAKTRVYSKSGVWCSLSPAGVENCLGAGGTVTSVDGSVALGVESIQGGVVAAITSSGSLRAAHLVNAQTGTTYTVLTGDRAKLVTHSNGSSIAVTLPQCGSAGFPTGWFYLTENRGAGTVTVTPTTSTIDGSSNLAISTNQGGIIACDGTNYFTMRGGVGGVSLSVANTWTAQQTFSSNNGGIPFSWRNIDMVSVNGHNGYALGNSERIYTWADSSACSNSNGPTFGISLTSDCPSAKLQVRAVTGISQNSGTLFGIDLNGDKGATTGNNSGVTGAKGGPVTFTAGDGRGYNAGSGSTGGLGGDASLIAGNGGTANSGSTNGNGGSLILKVGAPGGGGGTAGVDGTAQFTGHWQTFNVSGSTSLSSCGTSPTIVGTDTAGRAVEGSAATGCTISFARTWANAPKCVVTPESGLTFSYSVSTTAITITNIGALSSTALHYICME
jgi:hypothetical protein